MHQTLSRSRLTGITIGLLCRRVEAQSSKSRTQSVQRSDFRTIVVIALFSLLQTSRHIDTTWLMLRHQLLTAERHLRLSTFADFANAVFVAFIAVPISFTLITILEFRASSVVRIGIASATDTTEKACHALVVP